MVVVAVRHRHRCLPDRPFTLYACSGRRRDRAGGRNTSAEHATITGTLTEQGSPAGETLVAGEDEDDAREGRFKATTTAEGTRVIVHHPAPMPPGTNPGLGLGRTTRGALSTGEQLVFLFDRAP